MAFNVFQTAVEEGVTRVVMSSSNHAADFWEPQILEGTHDTIDPDGLARSDNYYGWAKIACTLTAQRRAEYPPPARAATCALFCTGLLACRRPRRCACHFACYTCIALDH